MHKHGSPTPRWVLVAWSALAALLLYLPHTAGAVTIAEDLALAEGYWGESPPGCISRAVLMVPTFSTPERIGEATIPRPGEPIPCTMWIREGLTMREQCLIVVHEFGHWLGLPHSNDPTSPMYPDISASHVGVCIEQWLGVRWQRCEAMQQSLRRHRCFQYVNIDRHAVL